MKKKYFFTISIIILGILTLLKINVKSDNALAVYVDNALKDNIPSKADNLYINKIDCDNDATATWDNDNWGLFISNLSKKAKCNLYFIHDNEKPYWQIKSVEKVNVLSTDILEFKIAGTDSLGNVSSNLDISNLSFYVNDELESPIKVELTKLEELNKKITYSIKVHMVGGSGNLKVKISSGTLTDTSNNQNAEITLDTGINVSKNPAKILDFYDSNFPNISYYQNLLNNYYSNVTHKNDLSLDEMIAENFDLIYFNNDCWTVPTLANYIFSLGINVFSVGNDSTSNLDIIKENTRSSSVGNHFKVLNNSLTYYVPSLINGGNDALDLIKYADDAIILYKNETNNIEYDSMGYISKNGKVWLHSQYISIPYIVPMIQFTLGQL